MIPKEILQKVRRIQIHTSHVVDDMFAGRYESVFKGRGMEFEEVREYQPGDDIRTIDWNVTARTGRPHVKRFVEERELTVMLLVDASASGKFGSGKRTKNEVAAELAAVLAFSAIRNNDKVGLIVFTDEIEKYVPPDKGRTHVLRVIREVLYFQPRRSGTDIRCALEFLNMITTRRVVAFLISDFLAERYEKVLRITNKRHDVIAIRIVDPREIELPPIGLIQLQDAESGEEILVDTRDANTRRAFTVLNTTKIRNDEQLFGSMDVDTINIRTDQSYVEPLMRFFRTRERRR